MSTSTAAEMSEINSEGVTAPIPSDPPKLDLSRLDPPADLHEVSVEEITIDGICGVY